MKNIEDVEIGINRYTEDGALLKLDNTPQRASIPPKIVTGNVLYLFPLLGTVHLYTLQNNTWDEVGSYTTPSRIALNNAEQFCIQIVATSTIPETAVCVKYFLDIQSEIDMSGARKSKNLIGSEPNVLYPIEEIVNGATFTVSMSDGEPNDKYIKMTFYDEHLSDLGYYGLPTNTSYRTIDVEGFTRPPKYISLDVRPRVPIQIEIGDKTPYEEFYLSNIDLTKYLFADHEFIKKEDKDIVYSLKTHYGNNGSVDNSFKALWVSDIHAESERTERMVKLLNQWGASYFDVAINTGDTVYTLFSQGLNWYDDIVDNSDIPILNTVGNHDAWMNLQGSLATQTDVYEMVTAKVAASANITQPTNAANNGLNYYYKDVNNVRTIVLDCMYWDSAQLSWFESVLADAKTNSKPVIACIHAPFAQSQSTLIDSIWNGEAYPDDATVANIDLAAAVSDFISNGGTFICWLHGHRHMDEIAILPNYDNQLSFRINSFTNRATTTPKNTDVLAYNYDCLTYVTVDDYNSFIKFYRIGANVNTQGCKYNAFIWDYVNRRVITEW